jgi:hypothetical protein
MLAGTEYCLTYPYLNLNHFQPAANAGHFNFDSAVHIIKQAPLINWMQIFPTEEMKTDHVDGYCICKVLVQSSPVLHTTDCIIRPLNATTGTGSAPQDFGDIMGEKLPNSLYFLMLNGMISHKLPQALAKGEWTDESGPLIDTCEFRQLLVELTEYRQAALGLLAKHLHSSFMNKTIVCKAFWETGPQRQAPPAGHGQRTMTPSQPQVLRWNVTAEQVQAELSRQNVEKVDFKFCLAWHAHECETEGKLMRDLQSTAEPTFGNDANAFAALVHLMVLEQLGLIDSDDGGMTIFGNVLKDTPRSLQEPCLVALELLKFGYLSGVPLESQADRPFPEKVEYPKSPVDPATKAKLLLCRVMSLVPMRLKNDMWNADVDFDLAAFHSLVRILNRALRQLVEGSLACVLLKDLNKAKLLPPGFMCASPKKENHLDTPALLPTFMPPRACMGIVFKFFLDYRKDASTFEKDLRAKFPCCVQPLEDLKHGFIFWNDLRRCIETIAEQLGAEEMSEDMKAASQVLDRQRQRVGMMEV